MSFGEHRLELNEMYASFQRCINSADISNPMHILRLPSFTARKVMHLCECVKTIFISERCMLSLHAPIVVVGDLHGHIWDLARIIETFGWPPTCRYLFLGDLVDRGEFSLETVTLVFLMKALHPQNVFVIRGNHEFGQLCDNFGFQRNIFEVFSNGACLKAFKEAFSFMPLTAVIDETILCVHGGIGPNCRSLDQIRCVRRPIREFVGDVVDDLLWSDPNPNVETFEFSERGAGYDFGEKVFKEFMEKCGFEYMIRAHQVIAGGVESCFDDKLLTVFSASNYCGQENNKAGALQIGSKKMMVRKIFEPIPYIMRHDVAFEADGLPSIGGGIRPYVSQSSDLTMKLIFKDSPLIKEPRPERCRTSRKIGAARKNSRLTSSLPRLGDLGAKVFDEMQRDSRLLR